MIITLSVIYVGSAYADVDNTDGPTTNGVGTVIKQ